MFGGFLDAVDLLIRSCHMLSQVKVHHRHAELDLVDTREHEIISQEHCGTWLMPPRQR